MVFTVWATEPISENRAEFGYSGAMGSVKVRAAWGVRMSEWVSDQYQNLPICTKSMWIYLLWILIFVHCSY